MEPTFWLDLFTATTWKEFTDNGANVTGFRENRWNVLKRLQIGDVLVCYLTGVMRWIGLLKVVSQAYRDNSPIWKREVFPCRVQVEPLVMLTPETAVPMSEVIRHFESATRWSGLIRGSPNKIPLADAVVIRNVLEAAKLNPLIRPVENRRLAYAPRTYKTKIGEVTIPETRVPEEKLSLKTNVPEVSSHDEIQWLLLKLGNDMGFAVWLPRGDRGRKFQGHSLAELPRVRKDLPRLFADDAANKTIENIDVLWLEGSTIIAAFEVEHTTAIYSGLLRMADLIAIHRNIQVPLFVVAPDDRREKVIEEVNRPTFSRLNPPLKEVCRLISYSALKTKLDTIGEYATVLRPEFLMLISESCELPE